MKRRRFLAVSATAAALAGLRWPERRLTWRWHGQALGAEASIQLIHANRDVARSALEAVALEIDRLEAIFSLYRRDSALVSLNREGRLAHPPADLVRLLQTAQSLGALTGGVFDITIQPLWRLYAQNAGKSIDTSTLQAARANVGYAGVRINSREVAFERPKMAVTLNGIAQGYIADRVTERLRDMGLVDVLVDTGELRASGYRNDGRLWQVDIDGTDRRIALRNRALATSSPDGTLFEPTGRLHHLLDPRTGWPAATRTQTSILASNAMVADALSTAASILSASERARFFGDSAELHGMTLIERDLSRT